MIDIQEERWLAIFHLEEHQQLELRRLLSRFLEKSATEIEQEMWD